MKGSTVIKKLNPTKKVYNERIEGNPLYPDHQLVIEPLNGSNGEKFFYIKRRDDGIEIMGEGYICEPNDARKHVRETNEEVKRVVFLATNENGEIYRGEAHVAAVRDMLGNAFRQEFVYT